MGSVIDTIKAFVENVVEVLEQVVEDAWNNIVAPIAEEVFNALGFEDETIITAYVVTSSLYGSEGYINPFKKIPINRIHYGTEVYDEIINIFISGEHIRIKRYMKKIEEYGWTPTTQFMGRTIKKNEIKTIIEGIEGEPITIVNAQLNLPTVRQYIRSWLSNNEATHGYTFDTVKNSLFDGTNLYVMDYNTPWTWDAVNSAYDINVYQDMEWYAEVQNAVNALPGTASTEDHTIVVDTAANVLAAPSSTYDVDLGPPIVVTVDTGVDDATASPSATHEQIITVDTGEDLTVPAMTAWSVLKDLTEHVLQELVPAQVNPVKQFEVIYTVNSDTNVPKERKWWFYELEAEPYTYPQLYPDEPIWPGGDKETVLPIVPLKRNGQWLVDQNGDKEEKTRRAMRRYGLSLLELTNGIRNDNNGNEDDIKALFFLFGINIATCESQSELQYLYQFFSDFAIYNPDLDIQPYLDLKDDIDLVQLWINGTTYSPWERQFDAQEFYEMSYQNDHDQIFQLLSDYIDPEYNNYWTDYQIDPVLAGETWGPIFGFDSTAILPDIVGPNLEDLLEKLEKQLLNNQTTFTFKHDHYNLTISYANVDINTATGTVGTGEIGEVEREIINNHYQLKLRKQINATQYQEIHILDLTGFSYIKHTTDKIMMTSLDFIGSDIEGVNVKENFVLPVTYGYMEELGIVDRKELLYRTAHIVIFGLQVTELRYYETAAFAKFFGFVLKVIAIVVVVLTWGGGWDIANVLWTASKIYGTKIAVEWAIQQILLANPDSPLAIALAIGLAILGSAIAGANIFDVGMIDTALITIDATAQVTETYTEIKTIELIEEQREWFESAKEKDERLQQAIDELDHSNEALLDYIKKSIKMKFTDPSMFYEHRLTRNLVDHALDLEHLVDLEQLLDLDTANQFV